MEPPRPKKPPNRSSPKDEKDTSRTHFFNTHYRYQPKDAQERAAIEEFDAATEVYDKRYKTNLLKAKGGVHIVDLHQADHYLFLSNEADVLREMRAFIAGLK